MLCSGDWNSDKAKYFLFQGLTRFPKIGSDLPVGHPPVIPGRAKREPGIYRATELVDEWIPGLRHVAHPGMTKTQHNQQNCPTGKSLPVIGKRVKP